MCVCVRVCVRVFDLRAIRGPGGSLTGHANARTITLVCGTIGSIRGP